MIGMIKKDLLMMKNNYKSFLIALVMYVFYSITFEMNISFFLPFMGLMISISTINYDDYNNWHAYATTLPQGKINVVKSKYITTIGIILLLTVISILLNYIISSFKGIIKIDDYLSMIMGILLGVIFMMSIIFPVLFKYGSEKGRIVMIIIGLGIVGIGLLFSKIFSIEIPNNLISFLDLFFPIIFSVISVIMVSISYYISKRIYLTKEF